MSQARISERYHRLVDLPPVLVLYLGLAFYQIGEQSFWVDEVISLNRASSGATIWTQLNSQSPLYFLLLSMWANWLGTSEIAVRSFSTLLGIGAVCITYRIGYRLLNRPTGLIAAILLATSPYFIWYSQEARYITLLILASLVMTYSFFCAIEERAWRWWAVYAAGALFALFVFPTAILVTIAHGLYLLFNRSHRSLIHKWAASQCLVLLVLSLGIWSDSTVTDLLTTTPAIVSDEQVRARNVRPMADVVGALPYTVYAYSVGFSLGPSLNELHISRSLNSMGGHAPVLISVAILFGALFIFGVFRLRRTTDSAVFLVLWFGLPLVGTFLIATLTTFHVYNTRYAAVSLPAYLLILATGLTALENTKIRLILLAGVLAVNAMSLSNYYYDPRYSRADARSAAEYLEVAAGTDDVIMVVGNARPFRHYYRGSVPIFHINRRVTDNQPAMLDEFGQLSNNHDRLWLVEIRPWQTDPDGITKVSLAGLSGLSGGVRKSFPGVSIYSYELRQ